MPRLQGPIVISRDAAADRNRRDFEDSLAGALRAGGNDVVVIPPLYFLRPLHPAARHLSAQEDLLLGSWLAPRAAFWTLRALGVDGAMEALNQPRVPSEDGTQGRRICCADLAAFASVEAAAAAFNGGFARGARKKGRAEEKEIVEPAEARWYPVMDYSLCTGCRKCVDFCLFGVYSTLEGRVAVTNPDNCKNGCPACARTCPRGAIMFPHYFADPAIAGGAPPAAAGLAEKPNRGPLPVPPPQRGGGSRWIA